MTTIYVLIQFPDSEEAEIIGLFSTRKLAEGAQEELTYSEIKEHYLNPLTEHPPGQQFWHVTIESGEICDCYARYPCCGLMPGHKHWTKGSYYENAPMIDVYCWATDEEHAKKIALDHYEGK